MMDDSLEVGKRAHFWRSGVNANRRQSARQRGYHPPSSDGNASSGSMYVEPGEYIGVVIV